TAPRKIGAHPNNCPPRGYGTGLITDLYLCANRIAVNVTQSFLIGSSAPTIGWISGEIRYDPSGRQRVAIVAGNNRCVRRQRVNLLDGFDIVKNWRTLRWVCKNVYCYPSLRCLNVYAHVLCLLS